MATEIDILGSWQHRLDELATEYAAGDPFPHVLIENFFSDEVAKQLFDCFPDPRVERKGWFLYNNPIERKFANNDLENWPEPLQKAFEVLQSKRLPELMGKLTGIHNLEADPNLHGAGLHFHPAGSKLDMHLDYSLHPVTGKERRINLIIYLNPNWEAEWGGGLQLWNHDEHAPEETHIMTTLGKTIQPRFNCAALFRTTEVSFHGLPDPITCPPDRARRSLAVYYVSEPREGVVHRTKAAFFSRPGDAPHAGLDELRRIRVTRRITEDDIKTHAPEWKDALEW